MPWSRLTTAYGRVSEFPEIFKKLARAIEACDSARGLGGEQNLKSEPDAGQNLKNHPGCGQNSTDAARCGAAQNFVNLAQKRESKFKKADSEAAKFKAGRADKGSDASEREKFDAKTIQDALSKIFKEIEHQSTFLARNPLCAAIFGAHLMQARAAAGKNANKNNQNAAADINGKNANGENEAAGFIAARLGGFLRLCLRFAMMPIRSRTQRR